MKFAFVKNNNYHFSNCC